MQTVESRTHLHIAPSLRYQDKQQVRCRNRIQAEIEPQELSLADEVDQIKKRDETEMYLLPGTGFQVKSQVDLLLENYKNNVPISESLQQLEQDIQGFKTEYLLELPVFPIVLGKKEYEGKTRLVGKLYGEKPFADVISADEREGTVKKSAQKIEEILLDAVPGTMVVMSSPKGWSGYQSRDNRLEKLNSNDVLVGRAKEIKYPDSQTYCYQVMADGSIKGFTLKTDMSLSQNKQLLMELGATKEVFEAVVDNKTDIKRVVGSVVRIEPEKRESIEGIAQRIRHIKGEVAYSDSSKRPRYITEMLDLLQDPKRLLTLDAHVKSTVDPLLEYISNRITNFDTEIRSDLETAIGLTVLKLMHEVRPPMKKQEMEMSRTYAPIRDVGFVSFNPKTQLEELQKIGGCAGGRNKNRLFNSAQAVIDSITPRLGSSSFIDDGDKEWFTCPKCSYKADGPIGNICPGCDLTKEDYAAEEGVVVCD